MFRKVRRERRGGGVILYIKQFGVTELPITQH